jgi:hypothetical protein
MCLIVKIRFLNISKSLQTEFAALACLKEGHFF